MGPLHRVRHAVVSILNPVIDPVPLGKPEPAKPEGLERCDNPNCCAYIAFGCKTCPWCGRDQNRLRPVVVQQALTDEEILYALEPDRPYDWKVDGL